MKSKQFNKLSISPDWYHHLISYPHGFTIYENLIDWVSRTNVLIKNVNDWNKYLDDFINTFDKKLRDTVSNTLNIWLDDGTLAKIINEDVFNMKADITYVDEQITTVQNYVNDKIEKVDGVIGLSPMNFGAVGDGVTDDTEAIKSMLSYLESSGQKGKIQFPSSKTFLLSDILGEYQLHDTIIDLNGSTLDFALMTSPSYLSLLTIKGKYAETVNLTADAPIHSYTVTVTDTTPFQIGDMVRIFSNEVWDSQRTSSRIGEIVIVEGKTATTLTFGTPISDTYKVSDNAKVQRLEPAENVTIRNGVIKAPRQNDNIIGVHVECGKNILIDNMRTYDIDRRHIYLVDCIFSTVQNCVMEEAHHLSQAYGISFADATRDCVARNNFFYNIRHALSTNNNPSTSWGIVRSLIWDGNIINNTSEDLSGGYGDAIDTHAGSENITITNNIVNGCLGNGINMEGRSAHITGNRIQNVRASGIYLRPFVDNRPAEFIVNDNEIVFNIGDDEGAADYGIRAYADVESVERIVIKGNTIKSTVTSILLNGGGFSFIQKAIVEGNTVETTRTGAAIFIDFCNNAVVGNNIVDGLVRGITFDQVSRGTISDNVVRINGGGNADNGRGISVAQANRINIVGNVVSFLSSAQEDLDPRIGVVLDNCNHCGIFSNNFQGATASTSIVGGTGSEEANNIGV